jgi:hypothetical protein
MGQLGITSPHSNHVHGIDGHEHHLHETLRWPRHSPWAWGCRTERNTITCWSSRNRIGCPKRHRRPPGAGVLAGSSPAQPSCNGRSDGTVSRHAADFPAVQQRNPCRQAAPGCRSQLAGPIRQCGCRMTPHSWKASSAASRSQRWTTGSQAAVRLKQRSSSGPLKATADNGDKFA